MAGGGYQLRTKIILLCIFNNGIERMFDAFVLKNGELLMKD
ncbi:hypothetical protein [Clostridium magnum]|nr:hypothetical protein [Clostridium magnum]